MALLQKEPQQTSPAPKQVHRIPIGSIGAARGVVVRCDDDNGDIGISNARHRGRLHGLRPTMTPSNDGIAPKGAATDIPCPEASPSLSIGSIGAARGVVVRCDDDIGDLGISNARHSGRLHGARPTMTSSNDGIAPKGAATDIPCPEASPSDTNRINRCCKGSRSTVRRRQRRPRQLH